MDERERTHPEDDPEADRRHTAEARWPVADRVNAEEADPHSDAEAHRPEADRMDAEEADPHSDAEAHRPEADRTDAEEADPHSDAGAHRPEADRTDAEEAAWRSDAGAHRPEADRMDAEETVGADEQLTVPEDREAAAVADGRSTTGTGTAWNGGDRPFELFSGTDVHGYRERWDELQASFVDDPKGAADRADALVGELVERVGSRHRELRDELGSRADQGDSTEAMRLALRQYRGFFRSLVGG